MTDKEIEGWLNKILDNDFFLLMKEIDKEKDTEKQAELLSDNLDIDYLENELGLVIRLLSNNDKANIIKLSIKGIDAVNKGGWIKYKSYKETKKRKEKYKKEFSYWIGIIIPFMMLLVTILAVKTENSNKQDILNKHFQEQIEQIEKVVDKRMETLTKSMDSVLLMIEQKKINDSTLTD